MALGPPCIPCPHRYTLDLRGELSAFDGQLLQEQADFALVCMRQLAAMYSSSSTSTSTSTSSSSVNVSQLPPILQPVTTAAAAAALGGGGGSSSSSDAGVGLLLLGHSMGGVIARAAAAAAWSDPQLGEKTTATYCAEHICTTV